MDAKTVDHASNIAAYTGAAGTGVAALWAWLGTNHDSITAICAIVGMVVALIGACINGYSRFIKPKADKNVLTGTN
jgi:hypothetical protein